ncbi:MAG: tetratricopeptide repeat protein [Chloroflexi bacterium]|nr:tetratricopeptide repeat protein [Chloroflexota bacterium]
MADQHYQVESLLAKRDYKRAEVQIARALRSSLDTIDRVHLLLMRSRVRLKTGRVDEALIDLQKVQALNHDMFSEPVVLELYADCHLLRFEMATVGFADRTDIARAREIYERILETASNYRNTGWIHYQLGRVLLTEYRSEEAARRFQTALLEPTEVPALTAYCYERLGFIEFYEMRQLERSLHFFNKAVDTYPTAEDPYWLVQVHILRSRVLRELKHAGDAVAAARTAVDIASAIESRRGLADALLSISETLFPFPEYDRETVPYLQHFIQISRKPLGIDVTWARVHEMLGDIYYRTGQHNGALAAYEAAFTYNPYTPWEMSLQYRLAKSAYQAGEYSRALQALDRMMRGAKADNENINDYRVYNLLGNCLYALNRFPDAIQAYERAMSLVPPDAPELDQIQQYLRVATGFARRV